jgi:hypothetical protein
MYQDQLNTLIAVAGSINILAIGILCALPF